MFSNGACSAEKCLRFFICLNLCVTPRQRARDRLLRVCATRGGPYERRKGLTAGRKALRGRPRFPSLLQCFSRGGWRGEGPCKASPPLGVGSISGVFGRDNSSLNYSREAGSARCGWEPSARPRQQGGLLRGGNLKGTSKGPSEGRPVKGPSEENLPRVHELLEPDRGRIGVGSGSDRGRIGVG